MKEPTLYAIPGWGFSKDVFQDSLLKSTHCIGLDYRAEVNGTLEDMATALSKQIAPGATLLGWSFGGLLAIKLASLFPEKIDQLILLSSQPRFVHDDLWTGIKQDVAKRFMHAAEHHFEQLQQQFIKMVHYPSHDKEGFKILKQHFHFENKAQLITLLSILFDADFREEYQALKLRILHINAKNDAVLPQNGDALTRLNPSAKVISIDKAGHAGFLTHGAFLDNIKAFMRHEP